MLEEAIKRCVKEPEFLQKVLEMSVAPFENYADGEEARLCGMGEEKLLGMQCSCSSVRFPSHRLDPSPDPSLSELAFARLLLYCA